MSRYDSNFREPPWVMGSPNEVMEWVKASHPDEEKKKESEKKDRFLDNLHIKFDFDVEKKEVEPPSFISKISGKKYFEEKFDLLSTAELILRGLAKAKFKNTSMIKIDKEILYSHPEKKSDLRETIDIIKDFEDDIRNGKNLEIKAIFSDKEHATAIIRIKKVHSENDHSVDIEIKGKIRKEIYHIFKNYLDEKIGLKED